MRDSRCTITITRKGKTLFHKDEHLMADRFVDVAGDGRAKVSMSYTRAIEFSSEKLSAMVTLTCNQDEGTIEKAGELAFLKVMELTNDGFGILTELRANEEKAKQGR